MGHSDDEQSIFEGFQLEDLKKNDESDVDLDLMVNNEAILWQFLLDSSENSDVSSAPSEDEDCVNVPQIAGPSRKKRKTRLNKTSKGPVD